MRGGVWMGLEVVSECFVSFPFVSVQIVRYHVLAVVDLDFVRCISILVFSCFQDFWCIKRAERGRREGGKRGISECANTHLIGDLLLFSWFLCVSSSLFSFRRGVVLEVISGDWEIPL